jgi:YHS domain-containing protein
MQDRPENRLRKFGPFLAVGLCTWAAAGLADDIPESVRQRALQELRVLDRAPRPTLRSQKPATPPAASSVQQPAPSPAKRTPAVSSSPGTRHEAEAESQATGPAPQASNVLAAEPASQAKPSDEPESPPAIQPARRTIVRPPIAQRPTNPNPWNEVTAPDGSKTSANRAAEITSPKAAEDKRPTASVPADAIDPFSEVTPAPVASDSQLDVSGAGKTQDKSFPAASTVSPFDVDSTSGAKSSAPAANPIAVESGAKKWRPATATPGTKAEVNTRQSKVSTTREAANDVAAKQSVPATAKKSTRHAEELGADRPLSVLDFLAQSAPQETKKSNPALAKSAPEKAASPAPRSRPIAASPLVIAPSDSHSPSKPPVTTDDAKVAANSAPRLADLIQKPKESSLESVRDVEPRLATPPSEGGLASEDPAERERRKLETRSDQVGFMGFCPVTLRDRKILEDGCAEFASVQQGVTITFASAEAKAAFDAEPERYLPAFGGRDIVLAAGHLDVPGSLRHATYFQNRLYLFRSEQTCRLFVADPARYVSE